MAQPGEMGDFTFDTSFFENGLKKIAQAMDDLPKKAQEIAHKVDRYFLKIAIAIQKPFQPIKKGVEKIKTFTSNMKGAFAHAFRRPAQLVKSFVKSTSKALDTIFMKPLRALKRFGSGIKKTFDGIRGRLTGMKDASQNVTKGVIGGMTNMILKVGLFALALRGVQGILNQMPEVGQAFGIAKDIFLKNFLFPLRKAVFPFLQKLLDWVRDNRQRFVKWGQTVANIFMTVAGAVKTIIEIGKNLVNGFVGFISKVFGTPIKNMQELMNILTFKFAVLVTMLQSMLEPLSGFLGPILDELAVKLNQIFNFISEMVASYLKGIMPALKEMGKPLSRIFDAVSKIYDMVFLSEKSLKTWKTIFTFLGKVVGTTLVFAFEAIATAIELISVGIEKLIEFLRSDAFKGFLEGAGRVAKAFGKMFLGASEAVFGKEKFSATRKITTVDDAIIKPDGKVIRTAPNDTLIATKSDVSVNEKPKSAFKMTPSEANQSFVTRTADTKKIQVSIDFSGMQIVVNEATPEEAQSLGGQIVGIIRQKLAQELEVLGV